MAFSWTSKARAPRAPTQPSCLVRGSTPWRSAWCPTPSHREGGPSSDQGIDEGGGCSAGSLGPRVRLGISTVVAEEALRVHGEGVRELQAVRKKDDDAQQHRLHAASQGPERSKERQDRRRSEALRSETETRKWREMEGEGNWKMDIETRGEEGRKELIHFKLPNHCSNVPCFLVSVLFLSCFCFVFETRLHVAQDSLKFTMELGLTPDPPTSTSLVLGLQL